jgi:hypothetical protein
MEKEFCTYEQALALKELGFDEPCFGDYYKFDNNDIHLDTADDRHRIITDNKDEVIIEISAPLYQQAFRWFREKYGLMHIINPYCFTAEIDYLNERIVNKQYGDFIPHDHLVDEEGEEIKHSSYEQAEQACLDKLIEITRLTKP